MKVRGRAVRRGVERATRAGYTVVFRDFVEDASTPGLLGQIGGRCDYDRKEIVVSVFGRSRAAIAAILDHECEHAEGAEIASDNPKFGLRCGNRACQSASAPR